MPHRKNPQFMALALCILALALLVGAGCSDGAPQSAPGPANDLHLGTSHQASKSPCPPGAALGNALAEYGEQGAKYVAKASSRALARALEAAGHVRPPKSAAHHVVAAKARIAADAREVLQRFGLGINDAANGVFLPISRVAPNPASAAVHSTLHTRAYYETVTEMLLPVTTRAEAEAVLATIRQMLLSGGL